MIKRLLLQIVFFFIIPLTALAAFPPALIYQTGQILCYNESGTIIECAGTGQDGELQSGITWPSPRFVDNSDQTVTDKLTGLIWSKDANPAGEPKTWQGALDYIKSLNDSNYLGYNDWRLPNRNELASLVNQGQRIPATWLNTQGFDSVLLSDYWSNTSSSYSSWSYSESNAWGVQMVNGEMAINDKRNFREVWPARSGQYWAFGSFIPSKTGQTTCFSENNYNIACYSTGQDGELQIGANLPITRFSSNSDQTITDELTGLIWSKDANPAGEPKTWQGALDYIKSLNDSNYLGYNDWRLPNRNELASLSNMGQVNTATWLNTQGFYSVQSEKYWSGSTYTFSGSSEAWYLDVADGYVYGIGKSYNYDTYVWPVRSGLYWALDSLILSTTPEFGTVHTDTLPPTREVEIGNRGGLLQSITSISISGPNATEFTITTGGSNQCGSTAPALAAGESCTLILGFSPTFSGSKNASLDITTNGASKSIILSGSSISTIFGVVTDQATGLPVSGAIITLNTTATTTTHIDGSYTFGDLPAATYSISISKTGYQTISRSGIVTTATSSTKSNITLPTIGNLNLTSTLLTSATAGELYSIKVMVAGGSIPYTFIKAYGTLPTGLTLDPSTGIISGSPSGSGSYTFAIGVADSAAGYSEREYIIDLTIALDITTTTLPRATADSSYSSTNIRATGGKAPLTYSITRDSPATGLTLTEEGAFTGTPSTLGDVPITVNVTDSTGRSASKHLILSVDSPLVISSTRLDDALQGIDYSYSTVATGGYGAYTWAISSGSMPTGLTLSASTGFISGNSTRTGNFPLDIIVRDAAGRTGTKSFILKISTPLAINTSSLSAGYIGTTYSQSILTTGGITPFNFSYTGTIAAGLFLGASTGIISGTPSIAGLDNVSLIITDSSYPVPVTVTQTLSLRVWNVLSITTTTIPDGTQKTAYSANLAGIGGATPHSWSIASGALPQGVILDFTNGMIAGIPENCGTFPFTTRLTDSAASPMSVDISLALNIACSNDYIISGNAGVAGATVAYSGTASGIVTADESGNYSIGPLQNGTYVVTPSKSQHLFTPASNSATLSNLDISVAAFTAVLDTSGPTFVLSTLADGAITNNATLNVSGVTSFPLPLRITLLIPQTVGLRSGTFP